MVSPPLLRRSTRNRTATRPYHSLSQSPPAVQRRKSAKAKKNALSRDSEQQQGDRGPAQQITAESTTGPSNPDIISSVSRGRTKTGRRHGDTQASTSNVARDARSSGKQGGRRSAQQITTEDTPGPSNPEIVRRASRGRKRKIRSDNGYDDIHASPRDAARDYSDRRPRKQRVLEVSHVAYPSAEVLLRTEGDIPRSFPLRQEQQRMVEVPPVVYPSIEPRTEGDIPRPVLGQQRSESVYQDENQENIPPNSELSTVVVSTAEPEHHWTFSRSNSMVSLRNVRGHEQRVPEAYEHARAGQFDEPYDETTSPLDRVERRTIQNEDDIKNILARLKKYERRFGQMDQEIRSLRASSTLYTTVNQKQSHEISALKHEVARLRPTRSIDARILARLEEIRRADSGASYFKMLDDAFFHHFGINWKQLMRIKQMPDEVYGAYYLRARTQARIGESTAAQNRADRDIIEQADSITAMWLARNQPENYYLNDSLFMRLFRTVCEREARMNSSEPPQEDLQPALRREHPRLAPSAMER